MSTEEAQRAAAEPRLNRRPGTPATIAPAAARTNGTVSRALFAPIAGDQAAVERAIQAVADVDHPILSRTLHLILAAGGKRLRPALTLLAARLHENALERRVELAVAAEMLHTATLVHDDVMDLAEARRGQPTINSAFNNTLAVLTGDYLFGKSGELVAGLGSPAIMRVFSWAVMELVQGEMMRPNVNGDLAETERSYLAKIRGKTASLLAMCCETGAMLDAEDSPVIPRLRDYGMCLGMAFQIVDDVLDFTATEAELGKPVGNDLRQGTITLPSIYYLEAHTHDALVLGLLTGDESVAGHADEAVAAIRGSGAIERALERARAYAAEADAHLRGLPDGEITRTLHALTRYVVERHE